jgi:hypothetical protein
MVNNNGACAASLSGNYFDGVSLSSNNTVQLQVNVTTTGVYSLQTNTRAGFLFSTAGSFSDTGVQTITLTGIGTPDSVGDFSFIPEIPASCTFTVSVTPKQIVLASYGLSGEPNMCANAQVNGQYLTGVALTGSNYVVLNVNVVTAGDYTIQTDTQNGVSFSATGTFTKTGTQTVTLAGSGTPNNARNLVFTPKGNSGNGCTFDLTILNSGPPATYVIESGQNLCIGSATGSFSAGVPLSTANTYSLEVYVADLGNFTIATATVNGIYFLLYRNLHHTGRTNRHFNRHGTPASAGTFTFSPKSSDRRRWVGIPAISV